MNTRRVEITEATGIRSGGHHFKHGDVVTVDKAFGDRWVTLGWAKDADTGVQGERIPGARVLRADGSLGKATKVLQPDDTVSDQGS